MSDQDQNRRDARRYRDAVESEARSERDKNLDEAAKERSEALAEIAEQMRERVKARNVAQAKIRKKPKEAP